MLCPKYYSCIVLILLLMISVLSGFQSFSYAEGLTANGKDSDAGNVLPSALFKGHVSNQSEKYILGPGDVISIKIKDMDQFNQDFTIRPDGYATIHPFGESYLAGTDIQGLQTWLEDKFKFYLIKPEVTVNITEMRPAVIYVTGAVHHPGAYEFSRDKLNTLSPEKPTQDKAQITVTNVLSKAGGLSLKADIGHIMIVHAMTGKKEEYDLRKMLEGKDVTDRWLLPEDTVTVPEMDHSMDPQTFQLLSNSTFFQGRFPVNVLGAVGHQGEVDIDPSNNSLNAAIALAGGFIPGLSKRDQIIVQRPANNGGFNRWSINRNYSNLPLEPGDIIYVSDSKVSHFEKVLQFWSAFAQPVFYSVNSVSTLKNSQLIPWP